MESCNKKYGQDERGLIKFIEPPDVRGIMYLTWIVIWVRTCLRRLARTGRLDQGFCKRFF